MIILYVLRWWHYMSPTIPDNLVRCTATVKRCMWTWSTAQICSLDHFEFAQRWKKLNLTIQVEKFDYSVLLFSYSLFIFVNICKSILINIFVILIISHSLHEPKQLWRDSDRKTHWQNNNNNKSKHASITIWQLNRLTRLKCKTCCITWLWSLSQCAVNSVYGTLNCTGHSRVCCGLHSTESQIWARALRRGLRLIYVCVYEGVSQTKAEGISGPAPNPGQVIRSQQIRTLW